MQKDIEESQQRHIKPLLSECLIWVTFKKMHLKKMSVIFSLRREAEQKFK